MKVRSAWTARAAVFLCLVLLAGAAQASGAWSSWKGSGGGSEGWTVVPGSAPPAGPGGESSSGFPGSSSWFSGGSSGWSVVEGKPGSGSGSPSPAPGGAPAAPRSGGGSSAGGGGSLSPVSDAPPGEGAEEEIPSQPPPSGVTVDRTAESYLFEKLNEERTSAGREPLASDPSLVALARRKARDMAVHQYFSHVSPVYGTVFDMLKAEGINYKWAGENIGRGASAASIHRGFVDSPEHRANLLSAGYTRVGVGAVRYRGKLYVAQVFMKPR